MAKILLISLKVVDQEDLEKIPGVMIKKNLDGIDLAKEILAEKIKSKTDAEAIIFDEI